MLSMAARTTRPWPGHLRRSQAPSSRVNNILRASERVRTSTSIVHQLREARTLMSPTSLTILHAAVATLFMGQQRSPVRSLVAAQAHAHHRQHTRPSSSVAAVQVDTTGTTAASSSHRHKSKRAVAATPQQPVNGSATTQQQQPVNTVQVVLTYEIDGRMVPDRSSLVDLRFFPNRRSVRISNHRAYDLLEGKVLTGWRRDEQGRLVAMLKTRDGTATTDGTTTAASSAQSATPAPTPAVGGQQQEPPASSSAPAAAASAPAQEPGASSKVSHPKSPASFISHMQHSMQQQLASSAAALSAAVKHTLHRGVNDDDRHRTYVPARVRPVMNEVYVPFGMWRDLFDGSNRPFPTEGLPLRVMITGAVQMSEQPALLVRRITPYGYYVLRGVKGLSRLKGKLMVRWSLLLNGVVEMEVSDRLPAAAIMHPMSSHATAITDPANN